MSQTGPARKQSGRRSQAQSASPPIRLAGEVCQDLAQALDREWLECNGRGGFASGTVAGANTRRYHALLLVARRPPAERVVLVNQVEEWVRVGGRDLSLATNLYPGAVHPQGYQHCDGFALDPWPTWSYTIGDTRLLREIFAIHGRDLVVVRWRVVVAGREPLSLMVRPKLTGRRDHDLHQYNQTLCADPVITSDAVRWHPYRDLPPIIAWHNGTYRHASEWFRQVHLPVEQARGLDHQEDWWSPGEFAWDLSGPSSALLLLTTEPGTIEMERVIDQERERRQALLRAAPQADPLVARLWVAADAYVTERHTQHTIVAGYPWFVDWGRDACLSLPGLCLVTGRDETAREVIRAFAGAVSEGMIPNRFPDQGEQPEYNSLDASLWFVHAVGRYRDVTGDDDFVLREAWPAVRQILQGYRQGTRYGIHRDVDGLTTGGEPGVQLTWMDAKVGEWVVTARQGKPVEIQALWVRALEVAEDLARRGGAISEAKACREDRARARQAFQSRFWYEAGGYLYDVVDGPAGDDATLRPNQLYALSLVDGLLSRDQARRMLDTVRTHLLTPVGLRTLAPGHPDYRARYEGGVWERDGAYHQGTVWPFLLGPFITAWVKTFGNKPAVRAQARAFLVELEAHLERAGLGQVSEVFDAEAPHVPRGCVAQAWSVAELLRVLMEDLHAALRRPVRSRVDPPADKRKRAISPSPGRASRRPSPRRRS